MLSREELLRYERHLILPEFGIEGQEKLKKSAVLVVGAGGLGCPALQYLAAAGMGKIGIADHDRIDVSNLQRQVLYTMDDIGGYKAEIAAAKLSRLNPFVKFDIHLLRLVNSNVLDVIAAYDVIIDGSDNFATRYMLNDGCALLQKPLVFGAVHRFEGQVSVFNFTDHKGKRGPTYRCAFPSPPPPAESPSCSEAGVLGVLPGIIGCMQANEAIKIITGKGEILSGRLAVIDVLTMNFFSFGMQRTDEGVPGSKEDFLKMNYEHFCENAAAGKKIKMVNVAQLLEMMEKKENLQLLDVREKDEPPAITELAGLHIPLGELELNTERIAKEKKVIIYCRSGSRSRRAAELLEKKFNFTNLYHLDGGVAAWIQYHQQPRISAETVSKSF